MWLPLLAMVAPAAAILMFDCSQAIVDGVKFDLHELGGPHAVVTSQWRGASYTNTSYTLDLCKPLKRSAAVPKSDECPNGTRVCAIRRFISPDGSDDHVEEVIAIAGSLENYGGYALEPSLSRLIPGDGTHVKQPGLRLVLQGGAHFLHSPRDKKRKQRAVIDFLCDEDKTGTEGFWTPEDKFKDDDGDSDGGADDEEVAAVPAGEAKKREEDTPPADDNPVEDYDEHQLKYDDSAMLWNGYGPSESGENMVDVLKLTWYTKLVCPNGAGNGGGGNTSSSWGIFTWIFIIAFLGIAAYLIFGSWINYNRHGARGWDALPHGDFIRDIPYLLRDWIRRLLNTVQASGSRGGYSAL